MNLSIFVHLFASCTKGGGRKERMKRRKCTEKWRWKRGKERVKIFSVKGLDKREDWKVEEIWKKKNWCSN